MISIKDKVARMIVLAKGELVCRRHAIEAGIWIEDMKPDLSLKKQKKRSKSK